jgi:hypothetical protein
MYHARESEFHRVFTDIVRGSMRRTYFRQLLMGAECPQPNPTIQAFVQDMRNFGRGVQYEDLVVSLWDGSRLMCTGRWVELTTGNRRSQKPHFYNPSEFVYQPLALCAAMLVSDRPCSRREVRPAPLLVSISHNRNVSVPFRPLLESKNEKGHLIH